jgi:ElaB/YqjD/DUF883 family membrane-anchored ribosome-binding protein
MASSSRKGTCYVGTDFAALKEHLEQLAVAIEQVATTEATEATKALSAKARDILSRATPLVDELAKDADKAKIAAIKVRGQIEDKIRKQPFLAVGIAAAVGFLLASLRRR